MLHSMSNPAAPNEIVIRRIDILSPPAQMLIDALNMELLGRYPEEGACHFQLDASEVADGRGAFLVAFRSGQPVGCGAVRRIETDTGEVKRMYVTPQERGRGVGRAILNAIEAEARALRFSRLVLETGVRQTEAQALYQRAGFSQIDPFGEYILSPLSICMAKAL